MSRLLRFNLRILFSAVLVFAVLLALCRDIPFTVIDHGYFTVSPGGELSVYEFYDSPHFGHGAITGKWTVTCRWVNRGENHWTPVELNVVSAGIQRNKITWNEPKWCSVSGSMTSITDTKFVRENGAYPFPVPWKKTAFTAEDGWLGDYDEFWELKHSLLITRYGVILQAGNGDDGSFEYFVGCNGDGRVCAIRCVLESDTDYFLKNYQSSPLIKRMWWNLKHRLGG